MPWRCTAFEDLDDDHATDRTRVSVALELARRVIDVALHNLFYFFFHDRSDPSEFGEAVHQDVVPLLRVRPQIEDLRRGSDIFLSALPALREVHGQRSGAVCVRG